MAPIILALAVFAFASPLAAAEPPAVSGAAVGGGEVQPLRPVRTQIVPRRHGILSAANTGRIVELPLRDGETFGKDQVVARLDCRLQEAHLARARATLDKKKRVHEVNAELTRLGSVSGLELLVSAAEVDEAAAEARLAALMVERCAVVAPFAGRVVDVSARLHQFINEGQPLMEVVDDGVPEAEMLVPSRWVAWLHPGNRFTVEIDELGRSYEATVVRLAGRVDAVSQSIKVYGRIEGRHPELRVGMSGQAILAPPARE